MCLVSEKNCGTCEKCVRTLLGIDALGKIDAFANVFDVDYYKAHKKWYLQRMMYRRANGKHDYFELYNHFKKDVTIWMRIKTVLYLIEYFMRKKVYRNEKFLAFFGRHLKKE